MKSGLMVEHAARGGELPIEWILLSDTTPLSPLLNPEYSRLNESEAECSFRSPLSAHSSAAANTHRCT